MPMKTTIVDEDLYNEPISITLTAKQREDYGSVRGQGNESGNFSLWRPVVQEICDLIDQQRRNRSEHFENVKESRWLYNATEGKSGVYGPWPNSANVHTPSTRDAVNSLHAHIMRVCIGIDPYAVFTARPVALMEKARKAQELIGYQLRDEIKFPDKLDMIARDMLIDGTAIAKIPWCREVKTQRELREVSPSLIAQIEEKEPDYYDNPENEIPPEDIPEEIEFKGRVYPLGELIEVDIPTLVKDSPDYELIPLDDFAIYPVNQTDLQKAILVGHRVSRVKNDLLRGVESGYYDRDSVDYLIEKGPNGGEYPLGERLSEDTEEDIGTRRSLELKQKHQPYNIWEVIYEFDCNGDGVDEDCLFTFDYDTKTLLRAMPLPYWHGRRHFVRYCPFPRSDSFFGDSLPMILRSLQYQENTVTNQGLDGGALANAIIATVLDTSEVDLSDGRLPLFSAHSVSSHNEIMFPDIPRPGQNAYLDRSVIRSMIEQASGVNDATAGISPSKSRPLGETSAIIEQAGYKFQDIIRRVQSSNAESFFQVFALDYQYLSEERELEITGEEESIFNGLTKQQIVHNMVITPLGNNTNTNREMEMVAAEKLVLWYERLDPAFKTPTRTWHIARRFLHAMGIRDYESFIGNEEGAIKLEQQPQEPPLFDPSKVQPDDVTKLAYFIQQKPDLQQAIVGILPLAQQMGLIEAQEDPQAQAQAEMQIKAQQAQADIAIKGQKAEADIAIAERKAESQERIEQAKASQQLALQQAESVQALAIDAKNAEQDSELKKESAEVQNSVARKKWSNNAGAKRKSGS